MPHLVWSQGAHADLARAYHFLAARDKQQAKRALRAIHDAAALLVRQPNLGRVVHTSHAPQRELLVGFGRSGYVLRYEYLGGTIVILGLRHQLQAGLP